MVNDLMMPGLDGVQLIQRLTALKLPPLLAIISSASCSLMDSGCMVKRAHGITMLEQIAEPVRAPLTSAGEYRATGIADDEGALWRHWRVSSSSAGSLSWSDSRGP